jgi:hypothetical protein
MILGAALGDGLTLLLVLCKWAGAQIPWAVVALPFLLGLVFIVALAFHGWRAVEAQRATDAIVEECEALDPDPSDWDAVLSDSSDDLPSTRG